MASYNYQYVKMNDLMNGSDWLKALDNEDADIDGKFKLLVTAIECPIEYIELFREVVKLIENEVKHYFGKQQVRANAFGSYVSGLCLKNCDLDINIDAGSAKINIKALTNMIRRRLCRIFTKVFFIKARVPIVRCTHEVGFECDISINNSQAVKNSCLVKFYGSLHRTFRIFLLCLKLWIKRQHLSGPNRLSSYAVAMLSIFYLQTKKLVPSVHELQTHPKSPKPFILDGWNCSFLSDVESFHIDDVSVFELLAGFFEYYSKFEFGFYVISPFAGHVFRKPLGQKEDIFVLYNKQANKLPCNTHICVQDPFIHSFNVCYSTNRQILINFQSYCKVAAEICANATTNKTIFYDFFFSLGSAKEKRKIDSDCQIITVGKIMMKGEDEDEWRENWVKEVLECVEMVLKDIAAAEITSRRDNMLICQTSYCVFNKALRPWINDNRAVYELQKSLTTLVFEKNPEEAYTLTSPVTFTIKYVISKPTIMRLEINSKSQDQYAFCLLSTLRKRFVSLVENLLETRSNCKYNDETS